MESNALAPLCFNRADFTQPDFNVDKFLTALKKHASFEQMQNDLRVYLKIIQNAMIELINQDYADFVNLSSSLVNLRATIDKLGSDLKDINESFITASSAVGSAVDEVSVHSSALEISVANQMNLEAELYLLRNMRKVESIIKRLEGDTSDEASVDYRTISRLSRLLTTCRCALLNVAYARGGTDEQFLEKHNFHLIQPLNQFQNRFQRILDRCLWASVNDGVNSFVIVLNAYDACARGDAALATFIAQFLDTKFQNLFSTWTLKTSNCDKLDGVLKLLTELRGQYDTSFASSAENRTLLLSFIDSCLLTVLLHTLDDQFSSTLIPSDAKTFHICYSSMERFCILWPVPNHKLLKMAIRKFSLPVYFRLRCNEISEKFDKITNSTKICSASSISTNKSTKLQTEAIYRLIDSLEYIWDDSVLLTPLISKSWDFCCKLLVKLNKWVVEIASDRNKLINKDNQNNTLTSVQSMPVINGTHSPMANGDSLDKSDSECKWNDLVLLLADVSQLESLLFDTCFERVWPKLRDVGIDPTPFGKCITAAVNMLHPPVKDINNVVICLISWNMNKELSSVAEIPRQYRWTRKEAPTVASPYLQVAFKTLHVLIHVAQKAEFGKKALDEIVSSIVDSSLDTFIENVRNVLVSVDKISTSLSKLKKQKAASNEDGSLTDDQKIRLQLKLDMVEFKRLSLNLNEINLLTNFSKLSEIENNSDCNANENCE